MLRLYKQDKAEHLGGSVLIEGRMTSVAAGYIEIHATARLHRGSGYITVQATPEKQESHVYKQHKAELSRRKLY